MFDLLLGEEGAARLLLRDPAIEPPNGRFVGVVETEPTSETRSHDATSNGSSAATDSDSPAPAPEAPPAPPFDYPKKSYHHPGGSFCVGRIGDHAYCYGNTAWGTTCPWKGADGNVHGCMYDSQCELFYGENAANAAANLKFLREGQFTPYGVLAHTITDCSWAGAASNANGWSYKACNP